MIIVSRSWPVSILDLLEVGFRLANFRKGLPVYYCFNPWFVGSRIQTSPTSTLLLSRSIVSILDLLEVGFRPKSTAISIRRSFCFNPWFVGSRIQTGWWPGRLEFASLFQSLICWKSDSDESGRAERPDAFRFQSLICWKSDSDMCCFWYSILISIVSILDLLEVGFRLRFVEDSLRIEYGFNPWFVGSRIQTYVTRWKLMRWK